MRAVFFSVFFFTSFQIAAQQQKPNNYEDLTPLGFKTKIEQTPDAIVIDLRTPDEIKKGVIGRPILINYFDKDFETKISKLDPSKPYFIYCASGFRSAEALAIMKKKNFSEVYNMPAGYAGWLKAKLPVSPISKQ